MKKLHLIALMILLLTSGFLFAWDGFNYVVASEYNSGIRIDWQAKDEHNVYYYKIFRSRTGSNIEFVCAEIPALGSGTSYTYQDENPLTKSAESGDYRFDYIVRAVLKDGSFKDSDKVQVALISLGVSQQTWGSIKAMFR